MCAKYSLFFVSILVSVLSITTVLAGIADNFINFGGFICPREERALGRCLRDKLNLYIPRLTSGVPEYGVPALDPLFVQKMAVSQPTGPVSISSSYSNVTVTGSSKMRVKDVKVDAQNRQVVVNLYIPDLKMKGWYNLKGNIIVVPIVGDGMFTGQYDDINAVVTIKLGRAPRQYGSDVLTCEDLKVKFQLGNVSMHFDNLLGANGELGNAINTFLNDNWQKLADELQEPLETSLRDFFKPLADHAFSTLNADDILSS